VIANHYRFAYMRLDDPPLDLAGDGVMYLDPLTSLAAYPSFERCIVEMIPMLAGEGLHIAIGDVDGLREYVSERRSSDPAHFGHLAGNACMQTIGRVTAKWAAEELSNSTFHVCGTFGGDEVIIAVSGMSHELFASKIHTLCRAIRGTAPRPCSFALGTLEDRSVTPDSAADAYGRFVSMIDARLFQEKEDARRDGGHLDGSVTDLGRVSLLDRDGAGPAARMGGAL
jgi:GGDEF domain-containing protein